MSVLVLAEHDNASLRPATLPVVTAALKLGAAITVLVAGKNCAAAAQAAAQIAGVTRVLHAEGDHYEHGLAEEIAPLLASIAKDATHVLAPATTSGKNILPRVAALLDVGQISEVLRIDAADTFARPIYAGNAIAVVQSSERIKVLTIRTTAFDAAPAGGGSGKVETLAALAPAGLSRFVGQQLTKSERPELTSARIIISGGRGVGSAENFRQIEALADKLGAAVGASRAAVDAGFVPNDYQVGQTGKIVAPDLYIAIGISGAIQHLAGMKDSKVIVAINKDAEAPIFEIATYGLVGDLFKILPELTAALDRRS